MVLKLKKWFELNGELLTLCEKLDSIKSIRGIKKISKRIDEIKKQMELLDTKNCDHIFVNDRERVFDMYTTWNHSTECVKCGLSDQFFGDRCYSEVDYQFRELRMSGDLRKHMLYDDGRYIDMKYAIEKYQEAIKEALNPLDRNEIIEIMKKKILEDEVRKEILKRERA